MEEELEEEENSWKTQVFGAVENPILDYTFKRLSISLREMGVRVELR
jgi:hypothetical protein